MSKILSKLIISTMKGYNLREIDGIIYLFYKDSLCRSYLSWKDMFRHLRIIKWLKLV